jgi:hypothetical protein
MLTGSAANLWPTELTILITCLPHVLFMVRKHPAMPVVQFIPKPLGITSGSTSPGELCQYWQCRGCSIMVRKYGSIQSSTASGVSNCDIHCRKAPGMLRTGPSGRPCSFLFRSVISNLLRQVGCVAGVYGAARSVQAGNFDTAQANYIYRVYRALRDSPWRPRCIM